MDMTDIRTPDVAQGVALLQQLLSGQTLGGILGQSAEEHEAIYHVGHVQFGRGNYEDAMRIFAFLLTRNHMDRRCYMGFAACLQMLKRPAEALKYYGVASLQDLTDPQPVMHSAECYLAIGHREQARQALDYALTMARAKPRHAALVPRLEGLMALVGGDAHAAAPNAEASICKGDVP
jgi:type III secretion system low calcium response chaperone LcrH/SycD